MYKEILWELMVLDTNTGNVGVGADTNPPQDFTIGCATGICNIQTRAFDGRAQNTVRSLGGIGETIFRLVDDNTAVGQIRFDITTQDSGKVCMGDPDATLCMLQFITDGPDAGQIHDSSGTCVINCQK